MTDYEIRVALEWGMTAEEIFQMLEEGGVKTPHQIKKIKKVLDRFKNR